MTMYRNGRARPTFDGIAVFTLMEPDSAGHGGLGERTARRLQRTATRIAPAGPVGRPPTDREIPSNDGQWVAFWPTPALGDPGYQLPNPPDIPPTVTPTQATPFVWQVEGPVGGSSWGLPVLQSFRVPCDIKDIRGAERVIEGNIEIASATTSAYIARQAIAPIIAEWEEGDTAFATAWGIRLNRGSARDIVEITETHDRRFMRVIAEDRR